ncbi:MAG: hypothetical protein FJ387_11705 [Verrucomicrobia bacterium]|nr:hypothetical protein [Verrucomicrobiota bacterium]
MRMGLDLAKPIASSVARRLQPVDRPQRQRRSQVTALDLEGGWLHVVQAVARGDQMRLVRHAAAALPVPAGADPEDPLVLGQAVAAVLRELAIRPGQVVMGVRRAQVMLRTLSLPPAQRPSEIAAMVHFQISRDLPFRLDEALLDFKVLPLIESASPPPTPPAANPGAATDQPTRVLAAVVRRQTVVHYQALARAAGLKLVALGLRSLAGARGLEFCHRPSAGRCVALVSLRESEVIFDVVRDRALVFSRVGTLPAAPAAGAPPERSADEVIESVVLEVVRSLHSYEGTEGHEHIEGFFLAGTTGAEAQVAQVLSGRFGVAAQVVNPAVALTEAATNQARLNGALPAIGLALGALDPPASSFDFLNPKRPPVPRDLRRVRRLGMVAGALAVVLGVAGLRAHWIRQREQQRAELQQQIALATKNLAAYRLVRSQARTVLDWSAASRNWLDHLTLLSALLPPSQELYLTTISSSTRNTLTLGLRVRSGETVDRLSAALRAAGYEVKAPGITPATDRYGYRFQANLDLVVPEGVTNDLDQVVVEARPPPASRSPQMRNPPPGTERVVPGPGTADERLRRNRRPRDRGEGDE